MGESCKLHVTMVITTEQEKAIRLMFKEQNWTCLIHVLSEETVLDIIDSGFTDVFPDATLWEEGFEAKSEVLNEEIEENVGSDSSDTINMDASMLSDIEGEINDTEVDSDIVRKGRQTRNSRRTANNRNVQSAIRDATKAGTSLRRNSGRNRNKMSARRPSSRPVFQCIDCSLEYQSKEDLWKHRNEAKHPLPTENIPTKYNLDIYSLEEHKQMGFVKCDGCDIYFLGKRRQMKHFYVVHRDLMPTPTCPICCKEFKSYGELLKHKREEGHRDSVSSLNNYQCDLCGKHMTSYSNFVQHKQFVCGIGEKEMEKIRIHACDLCGKLFKSPRHVRRHKKISHFKVPEVCDVCGTVCQGRKALDVHKKRHDERNKKHKCGDCGKAFFSDSKLQEHIRTHTKEKPFKCPLCSYTCAVKPNVHKHATNVHKQSVIPIDLRKTSDGIEKKTTTSIHVDKDINLRNPVITQNSVGSIISTNFAESQFKHTPENSRGNFENEKVAAVCSRSDGTALANSRVSVPNNHIPNVCTDFELKRNLQRHSDSMIGIESTTYVDNVLNSGMQDKPQATFVGSGIPVTFTDNEVNRHIQVKTQTSFGNETIPNMYTESNSSIQILCQTAQTPYNIPIQQRSTDYNSYPYQCRNQNFHTEKAGFQSK